MQNQSIIFPYNQHLPEMRFQKRFLRKFVTDYRKFTEVLLAKGYARKLTKEATEGRTWYVPHHGVQGWT